MSITVDSNQNRCQLRANGELTMTSVTELKERLLEALTSAREVEVDLSGVEDFDITAVQLLWAAARDAESGGQRVDGRFSEPVLRVLRAAGFEPFLPIRTGELQE